MIQSSQRCQRYCGVTQCNAMWRDAVGVLLQHCHVYWDRIRLITIIGSRRVVSEAVAAGRRTTHCTDSYAGGQTGSTSDSAGRPYNSSNKQDRRRHLPAVHAAAGDAIVYCGLKRGTPDDASSSGMAAVVAAQSMLLLLVMLLSTVA